MRHKIPPIPTKLHKTKWVTIAKIISPRSRSRPVTVHLCRVATPSACRWKPVCNAHRLILLVMKPSTLNRVAGELYDRDFFEWTVRNAKLLRAGRFADADVDQIAEEIEDMGKGERRGLESRLQVLLSHLLKWKYQTGGRSRSWQATIRVQRHELLRLLLEMPSLRRYLGEQTPRCIQWPWKAPSPKPIC